MDPESTVSKPPIQLSNVDVLIRHDGNIQVAVILDDIPDTAAVEAVFAHDGREIIEVVLISDNTPFTQVSTGVAAGNDDAAGSAVSVIVVGGEAHENRAVIDDQHIIAVETGIHTAYTIDIPRQYSIL